jgi:hypothetical protein
LYDSNIDGYYFPGGFFSNYFALKKVIMPGIYEKDLDSGPLNTRRDCKTEESGKYED